MSKKVLAIYYSQSGQLKDIIDNLTSPLSSANVSVEVVRIDPAKAYPFPWTGPAFFSVMPDCVLGVPGELAPFQLKESAYDLIIIGYQAWFLSPSIPSNTLLQHPAFKAVAKNTPIITITGARNMWINAFERVKKNLQLTGANLVGNISLVDKHANGISFFTILYWMFSGKKDRWLNIFPLPGVAEEDIRNAASFGNIILPYLNSNHWEELQTELVKNKAVEIKYPLLFIEGKAGKIFSIWANIIAKKKNKAAWLVVFKYYLIFALFIVAPILLTIDAIFIKPFFAKKIKAKKQYYLGVN